MKVVLGADAIRFPLTGIGRYALALALELQGMAEVEALLFLSGRRVVATLPTLAPRGELGQAVGMGLRARALRTPWVVALHRAITPTLLKAALRRHRDAVFHGPNFYLPPHDGPCVATFHDLSIYTWTHCHPPERVRYMQRELPLALARADRLIAPSQFARREISEYFGWSPERVHAVPNGVAETYRPRGVDETRTALAPWGLIHGGYTLFVGTIEPRKNIGVLLDAFERLPQPLRRRYPLVVAGYRGWHSEAIHARLTAAERGGWARYLDYVDEDALPCLMAGARAFAFPSLYEGFGLPVLEAMAAGVPVACSNIGALTEVTGSAALHCAPQDVDALTQSLERLLQDDALRQSLIALGLARAAGYSWRRSAHETLAVYRLLAD